MGAVRAEGRHATRRRDAFVNKTSLMARVGPCGSLMSDPSWVCVGAVVSNVRRAHMAAALIPGERLWVGQVSSLHLSFIHLLSKDLNSSSVTPDLGVLRLKGTQSCPVPGAELTDAVVVITMVNIVPWRPKDPPAPSPTLTQVLHPQERG